MGRSSVVYLAFAAAAAATTTAAQAGSNVAQGTIVFAADRAPSLSGEIYRLDRDGRQIDISKSPALDVDPAVSPNGRFVAFASNRGGRIALYTVRLDGTDLRRRSAFFPSGLQSPYSITTVGWSADGRQLWAVLPDGLWVGGRRIAHRAVEAAAWSPTGGELAWQDQRRLIHVVSPSGRRLWTVSGDGFAWSATGRLAVTLPRPAVAVYDRHGKLLARFAGARPAWSPSGRELATQTGKNLSQLQVRRNGIARAFFDTHIASRDGDVEWLGNRRLRISTGDGWIGYDVSDRRPWTLPAGFGELSFPEVATRAGTAVVTPTAADNVQTLHIATLSGGVGPGLVSATVCPVDDDDPFASLQFTPNGRSLVYQSQCFTPSADIYSVASDGTGLRQLTSTPTDEIDPAVSPDRTHVAYAEQDYAAEPGGPQTIWVMDRDGSDPHALTQATEEATWTDFSPSFSPDGRTILYSHWDGGPSELYTIPAAGGTPTRFPIEGDDPAWGPARMAFDASKKHSNFVETVVPDGSDPVVVAQTPRFLGGLAWSTDGRLAWLEQHGRYRELTLAIARGGRVARYPLGSLLPSCGTGLAWSPDGTHLAFTAGDKTGICDVWTVGDDGTGLTRVTHDLGAVSWLSWVSG